MNPRLPDVLKYFADCGGELVELAPGGFCPRCAGRHQAARLIHYAAKPSRHSCDARCMSARGPNCECHCGGKNHGAGFILSDSLFELIEGGGAYE